MLVACPTHAIKEYSLPRWVAAVGALTYPHESLLVDNSPDYALYLRWREQTPIVHVSIDGTAHQRIGGSMDFIRRHALEHGFDYWLSLECDVIAPPDTIETMLEWTQSERADWWCMPCPGRNNPFPFTGNFCCALFSRSLMEQVDFQNPPARMATDGWWLRRFLDLHLVAAQNPPRQLSFEHLRHPDPQKDIWW